MSDKETTKAEAATTRAHEAAMTRAHETAAQDQKAKAHESSGRAPKVGDQVLVHYVESPNGIEVTSPGKVLEVKVPEPVKAHETAVTSSGRVVEVVKAPEPVKAPETAKGLEVVKGQDIDVEVARGGGRTLTLYDVPRAPAKSPYPRPSWSWAAERAPRHEPA